MSGKYKVSLNIAGMIACLISLVHILSNINDLTRKDFFIPALILIIDAVIIYETTTPDGTNRIQIVNSIIWTIILGLMLLLFFIIYSLGNWSGGFSY